jgi:50S ribosomal protein L16 3-hydroxylase
MRLTNFDIDIFLRDYWQKKPLLIRNPWGAWSNPFEPDELAGLACEEGVESRLIVQTGDIITVENGPLPEARFGSLGADPWTLLVQAVDTHVPDVAALIAPFRFIPNWRIDDVMVSYANDGGGVGPHFDQYDVFLIQGLGTRRWQVGGLCDADTPLLTHDDLRLLTDFQLCDEWLLEPGDILYVPPRFAHNGVAVGDDCMTYSIGFRAPSRGELIADYADDLVAELDDDDRYGDPELKVQSNPGEISASAIDALHAMMFAKLADRTAFARWFGGYNSTRKYPDIDFAPEVPIEIADVRKMIGQDAPLSRNPASRFSFIRQQAGAVMLFVDGACFECTAEEVVFAEHLCAKDPLHVDADLAKSDGVMALIAKLVNQGSVAFEGED